MENGAKIFVAGHNGMVGSSIVRHLKSLGYENLILKPRQELDLLDMHAVSAFFKKEQPEYVFLAAAKVGGIHSNSTYPANFIYENLQIQNNVIHHSYLNGVKKLLFLGSSCVYPKLCPQPIKEEYLLTSDLEPSNDAYAIAKIAGIKMCQSYNKQYKTNYISLMPTNAYGIQDNYHPENSHVLPALLQRIHKAKLANDKSVTIWGTGTPKREFIFSEDLAEACVFLMDHYEASEIINVGCGKELQIKDLTHLIQQVVGYEGELVFDSSKPDGTPRKILDVSKLQAMGWTPKTSLRDGIKQAYEWYQQNIAEHSKI